MIQHQDLAQGRWCEMTLLEQLANTGSEIERSLKWKEKGKEPFFEKAFSRALELLSLTIEDPKNRSRLREITRTREALLDYFYGENTFKTTPEEWRRYFAQFGIAVRRAC